MTGEQKTIFVVDEERFDINCARLVSQPSASTTLVKFKHRTMPVHSRRCHDTLDAAKAALVKHLRMIEENVAGLEFDDENFWVA